LDSISIVIPAYNEEKRLPATLDRVLAYLRRKEFEFFEILIVDDGSTDNTAATVEDAVALHSCIRLVRNPGNRGKGFSVRHGMLEARGKWILFSDADLSAPIEELDKLTAAAREKNASITFGSRALNRSLIANHQSVFREFAGRFFNLGVRAATGLPFWDTQCGFKLFEAGAAREIFRRQQLNGFSFDVEDLFIARKLGFKCVEVPVRWSHAEGTKVSMMRDSVRMFADLARIRWYELRGCYK
jgi:glycosyltransferase involved in cell wall biosynthesis